MGLIVMIGLLAWIVYWIQFRKGAHHEQARRAAIVDRRMRQTGRK